MREIEAAFELELDGKQIRIAEHEVGHKRIFHIDFNGSGKPLVITVALSHKNEKFWTSIPEGRQQEAEIIGKLIADHIRGRRR